MAPPKQPIPARAAAKQARVPRVKGLLHRRRPGDKEQRLRGALSSATLRQMSLLINTVTEIVEGVIEHQMANLAATLCWAERQKFGAAKQSRAVSLPPGALATIAPDPEELGDGGGAGGGSKKGKRPRSVEEKGRGGTTVATAAEAAVRLKGDGADPSGGGGGLKNRKREEEEDDPMSASDDEEICSLNPNQLDNVGVDKEDYNGGSDDEERGVGRMSPPFLLEDGISQNAQDLEKLLQKEEAGGAATVASSRVLPLKKRPQQQHKRQQQQQQHLSLV